MKETLSVNILHSNDFDQQSLPYIVSTLEDYGHAVHLKPVDAQPEPTELLDCDVFIDRSPIVDVEFFNALAQGYFQRRPAKRPLMIDNPFATMASLDKRKTHALLPDLVPESYNLDGPNNQEALSNFMDDEYVVIKDPYGWYSNGIERLSPAEASDKYADATGLVAQKYIKFVRGLGRILTLNHGPNFEVLCSYLEIPDMWRSGIGATSQYEPVEVDQDLYDFSRRVTKTSGLYLNAIDYIDDEGGRKLLEINSVPNLYSPYHNLGVDSFELFVRHIEKSVKSVS